MKERNGPPVHLPGCLEYLVFNLSTWMESTVAVADPNEAEQERSNHAERGILIYSKLVVDG